MLVRNIYKSALLNRQVNIQKLCTAVNTCPRKLHLIKIKQMVRHQHTSSAIKSKPNQNHVNSEGSNFNSFTQRTHTCGELRSINVEEKVTLCGWVQFVRLSKFLVIRDAYGVTQCIVGDAEVNFNNLLLETIVQIDGTVVARPSTMINKDMPTGEVEVIVNKLHILNEVCKLPFNLRDYQKPKEQIRLQHRYIDLRFPEMQSILRQRSLMLHNMRKFLVEKHNFVEVETPTLFCRTPGGAREFVVPTHYSGLFYSLVQSPQQFKQMLMAGGIDRYFQVARCYRDETTRPDRQPEFTQLDIELSFTSLENIMAMIEHLLHETFLKDLPPPPFKKMTYTYALENYGSDKPNTTYEMLLRNVTHLFQTKIDPNFTAFILPYSSKVGKLTTKYREQINDLGKKYKVKVVLNEKICKEFGEDIHKQIQSTDSHNIVCIGDRDDVCMCLGDIREHLSSLLKSKNLLVLKDSYEPLWIIDFPLFTKGENGLKSCHHPFTAPHPEDIHLLETEPLKVRSLAYDIVLNGNEIGGGSIRIHNADLQERILHMLDIDPGSLSHFIGALRSGCPPHGGIALGIDRLMSVACHTESIRDVIAFPKSHEGRDPLSGAPNRISDEDKKYYNITVVP